LSSSVFLHFLCHVVQRDSPSCPTRRSSDLGSPYDAWSAGVRSGNVVLSNGPLLEMQVDRNTRTVTASASFFRPLEKLADAVTVRDRKSTRLNSSHGSISYAVFCLKKKKHTK